MKRIRAATLNSCRGLSRALRSEAAFREEAIALLIAFPAAFALAPGIGWFAAMIGVIFLVMAVELLNTCIEKLADHVTPEWNVDIGRIKDMGSAAVFCALCAAGLIWIAAGLTRWELV